MRLDLLNAMKSDQPPPEISNECHHTETNNTANDQPVLPDTYVNDTYFNKVIATADDAIKMSVYECFYASDKNKTIILNKFNLNRSNELSDESNIKDIKIVCDILNRKPK